MDYSGKLFQLLRHFQVIEGKLTDIVSPETSDQNIIFQNFQEKLIIFGETTKQKICPIARLPTMEW